VPDEPWVERSYEEPYLTFRCDCGWEGNDADVEKWVAQAESDRAVRLCPACDTPVPEWGTLRSLDGAAMIAHGPLQECLQTSGATGE
jgi:hypothetical protein